ncbi:MAG: hypothetical protein V1787_05020 [Candidatus Micrarchaeota archaeon]
MPIEIPRGLAYQIRNRMLTIVREAGREGVPNTESIRARLERVRPGVEAGRPQHEEHALTLAAMLYVVGGGMAIIGPEVEGILKEHHESAMRNEAALSNLAKMHLQMAFERAFPEGRKNADTR